VLPALVLLLLGCPPSVDPAPDPTPTPAVDDDDSATDDDDSATDDDDSAEPPPPPFLDRMLVLYDANNPESQAVAEHYVAARGLPLDALCPTQPAAPDQINPQEYSDGVAGPTLACIDGDWDRFLILVTTWGVPYRVTDAVRDIADPTRVVSASLDALLTRPWRHGELPVSAEYNPYFRDATSSLAQYAPPVDIATWRAETSTDYFLVARLDGDTPETAMRLVDDAIAAEEAAAAGLLEGTAYVDRGWQARADDDFGSYGSVEWDLTRLAQIFEHAGFPVVYDEDAAEIGTAPAPLAGPDALYYGGWYSFDNYNDVFTWLPGSVTVHFDSCSACDPRGGTNWSANVLQRGAAATMGAVAEPYVAGLMGYDQFFLYLLGGYSFVEAGYMATPLTDWMATFLGDPLYRPWGGAARIEEGWTPSP
jgi:uncharacterized protein (TIGR03790 family)